MDVYYNCASYKFDTREMDLFIKVCLLLCDNSDSVELEVCILIMITV